ncbi:MAG TPA: TIGR04282 family arsenosugar biosynthesis glycosyltransferase [Sporichthya sp.]|nr:TIGR04282 family arsenosugar biosynthesis glycosyltransferase [Sporichthya sp.]
MTAQTTLLVMAKAPEPGRVKTRLSPPFSPEQAASLALAALLDTLDSVLAAPAAHRVLALDGEPGPWLPAGITVLPQRGAGLDDRIANALAEVRGPVLLVGMDTPQLTLSHLAVDWSGHDAWFGPAADGGFWSLGLRAPDPALVRGIPMSRDDTGALQLRRLTDAGLRVGHLPELRDVDTADDARQVAAECPGSRFAACLAGLLRSLEHSGV